MTKILNADLQYLLGVLWGVLIGYNCIVELLPLWIAVPQGEIMLSIKEAQ